jgi:beta-fructofuranosidase
LDIGSSKEAGVILQTNKKLENGYYLYLEPHNKRLVFRSWIRMYEEGGKTFPYDVEMETTVENSIDGHYTLEILVEDTTAAIYINNETALSFRMYDFKEGNLGLYALGEAQFRKISLRTE